MGRDVGQTDICHLDQTDLSSLPDIFFDVGRMHYSQPTYIFVNRLAYVAIELIFSQPTCIYFKPTCMSIPTFSCLHLLLS